MTGQETSKETYFGPQAAIARTDDQAGPFHWNQNHSPVHIRVPSLYTEENNDSAGLGTMFPPGDHVLKQSVDDADLGNVDLDALKPQHLQTQILSFRRSDDYSSLGTYDENGFAKEISVPGAGSNLTSQSEADASVDGGKFACSDCGKTYMLESRLRYGKSYHRS
jgi:hypothetical protein